MYVKHIIELLLLMIYWYSKHHLSVLKGRLQYHFIRNSWFIYFIYKYFAYFKIIFFILKRENEILFDYCAKSHCCLSKYSTWEYAENTSKNHAIVDVSNTSMYISLLSVQGQKAEDVVRIRSGYVCGTEKTEVMKWADVGKL